MRQEVVEMRRGIDLLVSRDDIDPSRLGYVGFSWGGSLGAIFSAVERRVGSFVLMSLVPRLSADMRRLGEERGASDLAGYEEAMEPIDAINYLPTWLRTPCSSSSGRRTDVPARRKAERRPTPPASRNRPSPTMPSTS
jgi:pimeloyl-ACP methyl ester carboxylesterase